MKRISMSRKTLLASVCGSMLLVFQASAAHAAMQIKTGSFVGNGQDDRQITGLGFQPDVVLVKNGSQGGTVVRTSTMVGDISKVLGTGSGPESGTVKSLDPNGFTVGTNSRVNQTAATIYWVAFQADPGEMAVGSFIGNEQDNRSITGVGFQPGYVIVMNESGHQAVQRFADETGDSSRQFDLGGESPNRITTFETDGFEVGSHRSVNESGATIHFVAWASIPGRIAAGTYTGDGTDDRPINGAGLQPFCMILADDSGDSQPVQRFSSLPSGLTLGTAGGSAFGNAIQTFLGNGFEIGSDISVNVGGTTYYWVAFGSQANVADLAVSKTVDATYPAVGDSILYTVTAANYGPNDASGVLITDLLPAGVSYISHSTTRGAYDDATGMWVLGNISVGMVDTLFITASVDSGTGGSTITNTATLTALDQMDGNSANDSATVDTHPMTPLSLTLSSPAQGMGSLLPGESGQEVFRLTVSNPSSQAGTLTGISFTNKTGGPGTAAERDQDWGTVALLQETGGSPVALGTAAFSGGALVFSGLSVVIGALETAVLVVEGGPSLTARDGDILDLTLAGPGDVTVSPGAQLSATWPIDPPGDFAVDGMSAAQITVNTVPGRSLKPGDSRELVLDVVVPSNGYEADVLNRLNVINQGTAEPVWDIAQMELWADAGQPGFDPGEDLLLGPMEHTGNRWEITGLGQPLPVGGQRVFVSVDVNDQAFRTSSIQLALPSGPDYGVGVASNNSGPLDSAVINGQVVTVTTQDRVVLAANPVSSGIVRPGKKGVVLTSILATNTYDDLRSLTGLTFTNSTTGPGTQIELDQEVQLLGLHRDGNGNGVYDDAVLDPSVDTGSFFGGRAVFGGFLIDIAPGTTQALFLVANISTIRVADGDRISANVAGALDAEFSTPTAATGIFPVDSGTEWTVDGMVAGQIPVYGGGVITLGPADGPQVAFDFIIPANGYLADVLNTITVVNLGTADNSNISDLHLWLDGGDGSADQGAGDDSDLGSMFWVGTGWRGSGLSVPLGGSGSRFFITASVSPTFLDSADVRLSIPTGGIEVVSDNDGPIDSQVQSPIRILLSDSPLLASLNFLTGASTVGETVTVRMTVENQSVETIDGISPSLLSVSGTGSLILQTGPVPPTFSLAPGEADTFEWTYLAAGAGDVTLTGLASGTETASSQSRSARESTSGLHTVYLEATELRVNALTSLPVTLAPGQTGVVPLTLTFTNPGGSGASDIELTGLRIRLEDETGGDIVPADLLSRVMVSQGQSVFQDKTALEASGGEIDLPLGLPHERMLIPGGGQASVTIQMDLLPATSVTRFRVVVPDAGHITAVDVNKGSPLGIVLENGSFPVQTGLATLVNEAGQVRVTGTPPSVVRAGRGQTGVPLLVLDIENIGGPGVTSSARVGGFSLCLTDTNGVAVPDLSQLIQVLEVRSPGQVLFRQTTISGSGDSVAVALSPPLVLVEDTPVQLTVSADISSSAALGHFRVRLGPENSFDVRDVNTGNGVPVVYDSPPVNGNTVWVEGEAMEARVAGTPLFPASISIGAGDVPALDFLLTHPGGPGTARVRLDSLLVQVKDGQGTNRVPSGVLDRLRVFWNGQLVTEITSPPTSIQPVTVVLPGILLEPGQSGTARVVVDIDAGASVSTLQLSVSGSGIRAKDANLGHAVEITPQTGAELPLVSGVTQLTAPAREVMVGLQSLMPAMLANDGQEVVVGTVRLANPAAEGFSSVRIDHMIFRAADRNMNPVAAGRNARKISLYHEGALVGESGSLNADSTTAWVPIPGGVAIGADREESLEIRMTIRAGATGSSFRLGYQQSDVGVVQPGGVLLSLQVRPESGQTFPMWTEAASFSAMNLEESYSNFPNPFAAGHEHTSFTYYMGSPGTVTLKIWTLRGQEVLTILDEVSRATGLHQAERWTGRNRRGTAVMNGVYLAELLVKYDNGTSRRLVRKVAVVR